MHVKKLNTGITTLFAKRGGKVRVEYPKDKRITYLKCFNPIENK